ncbi:hypothetical protein VJ923_07170 [Adlercreutzia sp. R25]|uniref:hypothetical protein n=1 Tax=Adlercreutzia shanghongiae TaxID=3111773 RepID=UPI002DB79100|nr:hypothetical protein [Adlercreutzia sp. R25]MEC4272934.1 hypothetical protein [Adlercreutzia sp. R25]
MIVFGNVSASSEQCTLSSRGADRLFKVEATGRTNSFKSLDDICVEIHKLLNAGRRARVERILHHGPATILFWSDGEKTVVKCRECAACSRKEGRCGFVSPYDPEKAVMAAMLKRLAPGWQGEVRKAEEEVL